MAERRSRLSRNLVGLAVTVGLLFVSHRFWLPLAGQALIRDDGPAKADIAIVLAGDFYGHRIETAAELVRKGFVPAAIVSGPGGIYGIHESDLAIAFAIRKGYPAEWFIPFPNSALSTRDEAALFLPELRRRNIRSFLLITSDFHTARSARIFRGTAESISGQQSNGPEMRVVAAPDEYFRADSWWRTRQSQKIVFTEWSKTLATAVGL